MNKIIILLVSIIIIVAGILTYKQVSLESREDEINIEKSTGNVIKQDVIPVTETKVSEPIAEPKSVTAPSGPKVFTMTEVQANNTESNCLTAINGKVYDLTAFVTKHPGGDRNILRICGKDGSSTFEGQHGGEGKPEKILAGFEIGILK